MQDQGYRIIKLKNGDSLICKLLIIDKKIAVLDKPMQFKSIVIVDSSGTKTEALVFKQWIEYSVNETIEILSSFILAMSTPDDIITELYEIEKTKQKSKNPISSDMLNELTGVKPNIQLPPENVNVTFNVPPDMAEELIDMITENIEWIEDELDEEGDVLPPKPKPKAKKKNLPPKDQPKLKKNDFGNNLGDWSPDPKDYI